MAAPEPSQNQSHKVKFSILLYPEGSVQETIDIIRVCDELDFYAFYSADATYCKDVWSLLAFAADKTKRIRLGPNATHVILRDPALVAQSLATLDELTGGRVEAVVSFGGPKLLRFHRVNWHGTRPVARVKEALQVMRTFLDEGRIDFQGEFFSYDGLATAARPVQQHLPLKLAAHRGPRSLKIAGEITDGLHMAFAYTDPAMSYTAGHFKQGADKVGRDWKALDFAAVVSWVCSENSKAAKELARVITAWYVPMMPQKSVELNGVPFDSLQEIREALASGDRKRALELTTPELVDTFTISGTPEECVEQLKHRILPSGVNHIVATIVDPAIGKFMSGQTYRGVPDIKGQLKLIHDHVMPQLS